MPPPSRQLPDLRIEGDTDGVLDVSTARLFEMTGKAMDLFANREPSFGLRTPGCKPMGYRVTIFTANGYLGCLCFDYGFGGDGAGSIDMLRFLARDTNKDGVAPAITATAGSAWAGEGLCVPTTIDRMPEFPVLIEAGTLRDGTFVPSHRARQLLTFRFDRGYPGWVRAVQGGGR